MFVPGCAIAFSGQSVWKSRTQLPMAGERQRAISLGKDRTLTYEFWLDHDVLQIKIDRFCAVRFLTYNNSGSGSLLGIVTSRTTK